MSTNPPSMNRRTFLKAGAGAAAGGAVLSGSEVGPLDLDGISPTGEANAIAGLTAVVIGGAAITWSTGALVSAMSSDDPPDGLGPETLKTQSYQAIKKRKSVNQSTFVDNQNIIKYIPEAAFSEAKLAALDEIKNGATKDATINAGKKAVNDHFATVEKNLLKSWNESVREWMGIATSIQNHQDTGINSVTQPPNTSKSTNTDYYSFKGWSWSESEEDVTLSNTETFTLERMYASVSFGGGGGAVWWTPLGSSAARISQTSQSGTVYPEMEWTYNETIKVLPHSDWNAVWSSIQTTRQDVIDNVTLWVDNTYDKIQTGELSPDEYLSAADMSNMVAQDADRAQAIGDLVAMNVPGDYDQEATVQLLDDDITVKGYLATTDTTNVSSLSAGTEIDPAATDQDGNPLYETWYLAFRPGTYIEEWTAWDSSYGIQGGEIRFTEDPTMQNGFDLGESYGYAIETTAGETANVLAKEFSEETDDSGNTYWAVDLSGQLETLITDVDRVRRVYEGGNPQTYQTMIVQQPFKVTEIEGESSSVTIQQNREPQTDDNYMSDEEWQKIIDQQEELIKRYEDAKNSGLALPGIPGLPSIPTLPGLGVVESAIAVVVGIPVLGAILNAATN
ncbi:twin-arginine translocation signal domain-containing protein [Halorhabdus salina]|uniref:twin-arginine translocation signal domain-containing protein n=1 Tax=Halorhabdus salina TaxID=2750670 RepID=UPI0015EE656F|nr:twin-arginine translocation signal domain-containing protein [Halorhabdus salina]